MKKCLVLVLLYLFAALAQALQGSYEAPLPAKLSTDPDLCAFVPCKEVIPGADSFSVRKGRPSYVEAYSNESLDDHEGGDGHQEHGEDVHGSESQKNNGEHSAGKLVGYVFLSTDIVDIPAYSGKPVVTLIGMDTKGIITGIRILRHSEPILLVGIPEGELTKFTKQYVGKFVGSKIEIGSTEGEEGTIGVDAISGATVTVIAENQVILRSGYEIAKQVGIIQGRERPQPVFVDTEPPTDWAAMLREGSVQRLVIKPSDLGVEDRGQPYLDLAFGYLNSPTLGRSILGDSNYSQLMSDLHPGEHAIFIAANGSGSFKGSGFVRGGIFDRIQIAQEMDTYTFRDTDYKNLYGIHVRGAPTFHESGIFIVRRKDFSPAFPWSLVVLANKVDKQTGAKSFTNFSTEYWIPARYLSGGHPEYKRPEPTWMKTWRNKAWELGGFALMLLLTTWVFSNRDRLVRASSRRDKSPVEGPKYLIWTISVILVGGYALAQPSITQVLTWFHSIVYEWRWELFLSDPYIFIFWWFIIISVFLWGRGLFCGWLCPYGAMTEVVHNVASKLGLRRYQFYLPRRWHDRAKWIKYFIFAGLLGLSFYSMPLAERAAEIEPFKTTFLIGVWHRSWPFATYWLVLFVLSIFMERPFCKYLCPLGAALAIPGTFRFFGLKRKSECTTCQACAAGCTQLAIDQRGRIDQRECLLCLDCMVLYYDTHSCPPLVQERKRREKQGLPITLVNAQGYFEPINGSVQPSSQPQVDTKPSSISDELFFHLFPWNRAFGHEIFVIRAIAALLVVAVTTAWVLMATHKIGPVIVLAWWMGWSVYEILARLRYKPIVKDGPWWKSNYRSATLVDMISYVATKNLLIALVALLTLHGTGALHYLQQIPYFDSLFSRAS